MSEQTPTLRESALPSTQRVNKSLKCALSIFAPMEDPNLWNGDGKCLTDFGRDTLMEEFSQAVALQQHAILEQIGFHRQTTEDLKSAIQSRLTRLDDMCGDTHGAGSDCAFERALEAYRAPEDGEYVAGINSSSPGTSKEMEELSKVTINVLGASHKNRRYQEEMKDQTVLDEGFLGVTDSHPSVREIAAKDLIERSG
jgi:hypothetical protein